MPPPSTPFITIHLNLCCLESSDGWNLGALIAADKREKLNLGFPFKKALTFYFYFSLTQPMRGLHFVKVYPLCCEPVHIYAFAVSSCTFEYKSQQLVRRSSQPHGSSQIISSTASDHSLCLKCVGPSGEYSGSPFAWLSGLFLPAPQSPSAGM